MIYGYGHILDNNKKGVCQLADAFLLLNHQSAVRPIWVKG